MRQPPAPVNFRRLGVDRAFVKDGAKAITMWLITFDERNRAARPMTRNRGVVGADGTSGVGAGLGHVSGERATGFDERRQKRDYYSPPVRIGAVPDAGQTIGHCGPIQYGGWRSDA